MSAHPPDFACPPRPAPARPPHPLNFGPIRLVLPLLLLLGSAGIVFGARTYLIHPAVKNWEPSPLGIHRYQLIELQAP